MSFIKQTYKYGNTFNSVYNKVAFNEKSDKMKENSHTKCTHSPINTLPLMKSHL